MKAWEATSGSHPKSVQIAVWRRNLLGIPTEDFYDTYTLDDITSIPDLILQDVDLFLVHEMPASILGRQVTILGADLGDMIEEILDVL